MARTWAGIIAGRLEEKKADPERTGPRILAKVRDANGAIKYAEEQVPRMSGMAPECKLVSYKVLDADGKGHVSNIIKALEEIQRIRPAFARSCSTRCTRARSSGAERRSATPGAAEHSAQNRPTTGSSPGSRHSGS